MKQYKILETVMLGFIFRNDQSDAFFDPGPDSAILEREPDGDTIFVITSNGERFESITQAHAIEVWLGDGKIEAIDA
jgi:hypothetical protein